MVPEVGQCWFAGLGSIGTIRRGHDIGRDANGCIGIV